MSDSKVMVIGDRDSVLGFGALGVKVKTPSAQAEDVRQAVKEALNEEVAILFITERLAQEVPEMIKDLSRRPLPSVVLIPDASGSKGMGLKKLNEIIVKAVGSTIGTQDEES
ncbi:MAG: V-type ATP synthase subunit F [Deltaproteobacteria bacterium]|nr:V-type ATP synthase subunit F [Candidatus Zymogenaceae bacterium]